MGDYLRGSDHTHLPQEAIAMYMDGTPVGPARPVAAGKELAGHGAR